MAGNTDWTVLIRKIEALLRLKTFPVGLKLLESKEDLKQNKWARRPLNKTTLCQLITLVRTYDWTVGATAEDFPQGLCGSVIGLAEPPEQVMDGTFRSMVWCGSKADGKKCEEAIPRIPAGKYNAIMLAPQVYNPFEPDMVLIYGNAAQMILIINALQFEDYERMQFFCVGESSCSDAIAQCYLTGKPSLTIPCFGERRFGGVQDDELYIALPPHVMAKLEQNLEALYARGVQYPIPYHGTSCDPLPGMPPGYRELVEGKAITGLGVPLRKVSRW